MKKFTIHPISFCCAIYNESPVLFKQILFLEKNLSRIFGKNNFEIIIVNNGSSDLNQKSIQSIQKKATYYSIPLKGHGLAFKKAIEEAKYDHVVLSAIDLPFGFTDLEDVLHIWNKYDIIFGSKAHPDSTISVPFPRKVASQIFRRFLTHLFSIPVTDTQGSIFLKKKKILPLLTYCSAENAFFTAQLAIYAQLYSLQISEIPVIMQKRTRRKSKYSIIKDGSSMLLSMGKEYIKIKRNQLTFYTSKA